MSISKILPGTKHRAVNEQLQERFTEAMAFATDKLPAGYVKHIVWDEAGGYPSHAWGYVQYSPRPFKPGYGCDGTTDENVHLIAASLCQKLDIDYAKVYVSAYPDERDIEEFHSWMVEMMADQDLLAETLVPEEASLDSLRLMLSDLYQINNRSLVAELEPLLQAKGFDVRNWWQEESRLRAWRN